MYGSFPSSSRAKAKVRLGSSGGSGGYSGVFSGMLSLRELVTGSLFDCGKLRKSKEKENEPPGGADFPSMLNITDRLGRFKGAFLRCFGHFYALLLFRKYRLCRFWLVRQDRRRVTGMAGWPLPIAIPFWLRSGVAIFAAV